MRPSCASAWRTGCRPTRSAVARLVGGFLLVAQATGLPLHVLELGSSAGLILRWDAYRYETDGHAWGAAASPVRLAFPPPPMEVATTVIERRGCDPRPIDPTSAEGRVTLLSYVWPDQRWRMKLLSAALDVAASVPASVDRAAAGDWLAERLAEPADERATVVFHSIVMQYLPEAERERVEGLLRAAGARATPENPVAWLRMEPPRRPSSAPASGSTCGRAGAMPTSRRRATTGGRSSGRAGERPVAALHAG
jgi:hypothetical protein